MDYNKSHKKESPFLNVMGMGGGIGSFLTLASGEGTYVDDLFRISPYVGDGSSSRVVPSIGITTDGGAVIVKKRFSVSSTNSGGWYIADTVRGAGKLIRPDDTDVETTFSDRLYEFTSSGFKPGNNGELNESSSGNTSYISYTFKKAEKFFDVVTWTGNDVQGREIPHNLGSVPGMIWVKNLDTTDAWCCYHVGLGNTKYERLDYHSSGGTAADRWDNTTPTDSVFTIGNSTEVNKPGSDFVAYLFAIGDDAFGTNSDEKIIKCGSYTGNGSTGQVIDVGFEPQWLVVKRDGSDAWRVYDNFRKWYADDGSNIDTTALSFDTSAAESTGQSYSRLYIKDNGFKVEGDNGEYNENNNTYIYMAIRRPHRPPTTGTEVYFPKTWTGTGSSHTYDAGFPMDLIFHTYRTATNQSTWIYDRLRGNYKRLISHTNSSEDSANFLDFDKGSSVGINGNSSGYNASGETYIHHVFRRAPKFLDILAYTGTGSARNMNHDLTVEPELVIIRSRSANGSWVVGSTAFSSGGHLVLDETGGLANVGGTARFVYANWSSTVLGIGADSDVNNSGTEYVAYLFASLDGVSKIGTYTGDGGNNNYQNVTSSEPRFVLIKRTDSSGGWYVFDSARGSGSGNDPYFLLNSTDSEQTGYNMIHTNAVGFTPFGDINTDGAEYVYLLVL
jgi:hypothetical protein|tara:strand:- start:5 stop:2020 length:2016 start_codon:yes stop_codon:yes gene_type:complete